MCGNHAHVNRTGLGPGLITVLTFLYGAVAMGCFTTGLIFLHYWRESRTRLFIYFAAAFWIFAVNYLVLALMPAADERRPYVYAIRLIGFLTILWGIIQNNRTPSPRAQ